MPSFIITHLYATSVAVAEWYRALHAAGREMLTSPLGVPDFLLAFSRELEPSVRAVVYDYHLLGIGLAYSDCRNVAGSLGERVQSAFWEAYGSVDEREALKAHGNGRLERPGRGVGAWLRSDQEKCIHPSPI